MAGHRRGVKGPFFVSISPFLVLVSNLWEFHVSSLSRMVAVPQLFLLLFSYILFDFDLQWFVGVDCHPLRRVIFYGNCNEFQYTELVASDKAL